MAHEPSGILYVDGDDIEKLIITGAIIGGSSPQGNPYLPKNPKTDTASIGTETYLLKWD
jgi:hypothetical protein